MEAHPFVSEPPHLTRKLELDNLLFAPPAKLSHGFFVRCMEIEMLVEETKRVSKYIDWAVSET